MISKSLLIPVNITHLNKSATLERKGRKRKRPNNFKLIINRAMDGYQSKSTNNRLTFII